MDRPRGPGFPPLRCLGGKRRTGCRNGRRGGARRRRQPWPAVAAGYVSTLKCVWVDGHAVPVVTDAAPGLVATEAAKGFAQPALRASAPLLPEKARRQG